ncbi:Basement membrane-specific heparan sulfate proteoglycan core protein [Mortierella sp. AD031]|nr:Basement membrane-specific heparan sulfate proteoglycan core protein [Mortierella sp. AD031]KAG0219531.1 Basement membrane-specific heparan sulfate proteoglycan core protein [Mortierella sp. NVP41]
MQFLTLITLTVAVFSAATQAAPPAKCYYECPDVISPVCAADSTGTEFTFDNSCLLARRNCLYPSNKLTVIHKGECASHLDKRADCSSGKCPSVLDYVCGTNAAGSFNTFKNSCLVYLANCKNPSAGWTVAHKGTCEGLKKRFDIPSVFPKPGCGGDCPSVIAPVCAKNGAGEYLTFVNSCLFSIANCEYPQDPYVIEYNRTCDKDLP